jgi:hypothetical protein
MKLLKYILSVLLLSIVAINPVFSQAYEIDNVCVGAIGHYRVDGQVGSVYQWTLTDTAGNETILPQTTDSITIIWNKPPGIYYLSTIQSAINSCNSVRELGYIKVSSPPTINAFNLPLATACPSMGSYEVSVDVSGGVPPYTYSWTGADIIPGTNRATVSEVTTGFCNHTYTVDVIITDSLGCSVSQQQTFTIIDTISPNLLCNNTTIYLDQNGQATISQEDVIFSLNDNCTDSTQIIVSLSQSTFNATNIGDNLITIVAEDICGNQISCVSTVTILDNLPPVIGGDDQDPNTTEISCSSIGSPVVFADSTGTYTHNDITWDVTAIDNATSPSQLIFSYALTGATTGSGSTLNGVSFNIGTTNVTWTVIDTSGNMAICAFAVTVDTVNIAGLASASQIICQGDIPNNLTLSGYMGTIQWQSSTDSVTFSDILGETSSTLSLPSLNITTYYRAVVTNGAIGTENSNIVTIQVIVVDAPTLVVVQPTCDLLTGSVTISNISSENTYTFNPAGPTVGADGVVNNLVVNTTYTITANNNGCSVSSISFTLDNSSLDCDDDGVTIGDGDPDDNDPCNPNMVLPPTALDQTFCVLDNPTIADLVVIGSNIKWYDAIVNGNLLPLATPLTNNTNYYASQTEHACESARATILVTITDTIAPIFSIDTIYCIDDNDEVLPTISDNGIEGTWSPAIINKSIKGTKVYVFTPNAGECANVITKNITVSSIAVVVKQPVSQYGLCDSLSEVNLTIEVHTSDSIELHYQWYHNGVAIPGATSPNYTEPFTLSLVGDYYVEVTGCCIPIISVEVEVRESSLYVEEKWDDVLAVDNHNDEFVAYQWYKDGEPIKLDGNSQYYTDLNGLNGYYHVVAAYANGTTMQSCPVFYQSNKNYTIKLYPNPGEVGQTINIELQGNEGDYQIEIFDAIGRKIHNQKGKGPKATIKANMIMGTYVVRVSTDNLIESVPLIIKN